jgi:hypothetical protein
MFSWKGKRFKSALIFLSKTRGDGEKIMPKSKQKSMLVVCDKIEEIDDLVQRLDSSSNVDVTCVSSVYQAVDLLKKQRFNLTYYRHVEINDPSRTQIFNILPEKNRISIEDIANYFLGADRIAELKSHAGQYPQWQSDHACLGELASLLSLANDKSDRVVAEVVRPFDKSMKLVVSKYGLGSVQIEPYDIDPMTVYHLLQVS